MKIAAAILVGAVGVAALVLLIVLENPGDSLVGATHQTRARRRAETRTMSGSKHGMG